MADDSTARHTGARIRVPSRAAVALMVCAASMTTTGCFDREELEQQAFVTSMGIDAAPGGMMDCTLLIALPKAAAGSSGGGSGGDQPLASKGPITVRGRTVMEAVTLANASVERKLTLSHLDSIILGEDLAKEGIPEVIRPLTRFREFRRTIYLKVAKGQAKDILTSEKPMLETTLTRVSDDVQNVGKRTGMSPADTHLQDLAIALESPHQGAILPVYAVNDTVKSDPKGEGKIEGKVNSEAGQIKRAGGNPVEYVGGAVLEHGKLVGYLSGEQMIYIRMLRGTLNRAMLDFPDPTEPKHMVTLSARKERSPKFQVVMSNPMRINISLPLDADLVGVGGSSDFTQPLQRRQLEKYVDGQIARRARDLVGEWAKQGVDIVPISNSIRGAFWTDAQFTHFPWGSRLKTADIHVNVDLHIRRFGIQLAPIKVET